LERGIKYCVCLTYGCNHNGDNNTADNSPQISDEMQNMKSFTLFSFYVLTTKYFGTIEVPFLSLPRIDTFCQKFGVGRLTVKLEELFCLSLVTWMYV